MVSPPSVGSCQSENPTIAESEVYPLYELVRDLFQRISENSVKAKFAFWGFSEVSLYGVLRSSTRAAVSLCHRPVLVWRPEVGELGEEVLVWSHLVLRHPPVRQDGDQAITHIIGEQTTVVRVANRSRGVVGQDSRQHRLRQPPSFLR